MVGPDDDVLIPRGSIKTDWEVELAVVIGSTAATWTRSARPAACIAGYTISNDVSEREFQLERGGQWDKGKNCETFNPLGPWMVSADEVADPQNLGLRLWVNGELRQDGTTADMIFGVDHLVWYLSQFMVLHPGDIINTGTPAGVAMGSAAQPLPAGRRRRRRRDRRSRPAAPAHRAGLMPGPERATLAGYAHRGCNATGAEHLLRRPVRDRQQRIPCSCQVPLGGLYRLGPIATADRLKDPAMLADDPRPAEGLPRLHHAQMNLPRQRVVGAL